jgi:hypothetical protein
MLHKKVRKHQEEEIDHEPRTKSSSSSSSAGSSPASTPRKLQNKGTFCKKNKKGGKNPYATRGLDKFSALLVEIEEKKQKIYSQKNSQDISFVRFMFSDSDDCVPIVVKAKKENDQQQVKTKQEDKLATKIKTPEEKQEVKQEKTAGKIFEKNRFSIDLMVCKLRRPCYYLPVVIVFILVLLALSGRSFAILCTCIGWYIIPTLQHRTSQSQLHNNIDNKKPTMKIKKDYVRRVSEINKNRNPVRNHRNSW